MKVSARNTLSGTIKDLDIGDIQVEVSIEITKTQNVKILIPTQVLDRLQLKENNILEVTIDSRSIVLVKMPEEENIKDYSLFFCNT